MVCFVLALILPLFGFIVPSLGLSRSASTVIIGFLIAGGPEVAILLAAILWGRETLNYFKGKVLSFLRQKVFLRSVSRFEYYFGLFVNLASIFPLYLHAYWPLILPFDPLSNERVYFLLVFDLLFVGSFFFLGAQFWEKVRRIFTYDLEPEVHGPQ
jgi:hypothetical protein